MMDRSMAATATGSGRVEATSALLKPLTSSSYLPPMASYRKANSCSLAPREEA